MIHCAGQLKLGGLPSQLSTTECTVIFTIRGRDERGGANYRPSLSKDTKFVDFYFVDGARGPTGTHS